MSEGNMEPNEIIRFMEGDWNTTDVMVSANGEVSTDVYTEEVRVKDHETMEITAKGIQGGKVITRDMVLSMEGGITMKQGNFTMRGEKKGNAISLSGEGNGNKFEIRICLLEKSFTYQMDVWNGGRIIQVQMSHVTRKN